MTYGMYFVHFSRNVFSLKTSMNQWTKCTKLPGAKLQRIFLNKKGLEKCNCRVTEKKLRLRKTKFKTIQIELFNVRLLSVEEAYRSNFQCVSSRSLLHQTFKMIYNEILIDLINFIMNKDQSRKQHNKNMHCTPIQYAICINFET